MTKFIDACGAQQAGIDAQIQEQRMSEQIPTIGRIVHYRLSADDATQINRRRTSGKSIAERMKAYVSPDISGPPRVPSDDPLPPPVEAIRIAAWPAGAQAHIGNEAKEGDTFPMLITKCWGDTPTASVNGQAFLDGNDVRGVTS